jgi:hypothetical protein
MRTMQITCTPTADEDTTAAILAAIAAVLDQEHIADARGPITRPALWKAAAVLAAHGLPPTRRPVHPTWATAPRAEREARWSSGIVGM